MQAPTAQTRRLDSRTVVSHVGSKAVDARGSRPKIVCWPATMKACWPVAPTSAFPSDGSRPTGCPEERLRLRRDIHMRQEAGDIGSVSSVWNSDRLTAYSSGLSVATHVFEAGSASGTVVSSDGLLDWRSAITSWRAHSRPSAQASPQSRARCRPPEGAGGRLAKEACSRPATFRP